jgi:hypothetical protein
MSNKISISATGKIELFIFILCLVNIAIAVSTKNWHGFTGWTFAAMLLIRGLF